MKHFFQLMGGIDTVPALLQLHGRPDLWDANTFRKARSDSPHLDMSDIWVRYRDDTDCKASGDYSAFNEPHDAIWYPAWTAIPALRPIVFGLMARAEATALGGVLITKIPPGGSIKPHVDNNWHSRHFNLKVYVPLKSNPRCINECGGEVASMAAGTAWTFDNSVSHSVFNDGADDRITLITCMRTH